MTKPDTLEKQRFFAQYWAQEVCEYRGFENIPWVGGREVCAQGCLSLYSLSDITDKDAIEVGRIINNYPGSNYQDNLEYCMKLIQRVVSRNNWHLLKLHAIDYLRSCGYALPFNGRSVEEMEELGWLKIRNRCLLRIKKQSIV